jgi:hypothetical protein
MKFILIRFLEFSKNTFLFKYKNIIKRNYHKKYNYSFEILIFILKFKNCKYINFIIKVKK